MIGPATVFVPRRRLDEDLRRSLGEAAFTSFVEDGLERSSPMRIAARAGLPVDLVLRVCRSHVDALMLICEVRVSLLAERLRLERDVALDQALKAAVRPLLADLEDHADVLRRQLTGVLAVPATRSALLQGVFCRQSEFADALRSHGVADDMTEMLAGCVLQRVIAMLDVWCVSERPVTQLFEDELAVLRHAFDRATGVREVVAA